MSNKQGKNSREDFISQLGLAILATTFGCKGQSRPKRVLIRPYGQTVNMVDIAYTPGLLSKIETYLPYVKLPHWSGKRATGVEKPYSSFFLKKFFIGLIVLLGTWAPLSAKDLYAAHRQGSKLNLDPQRVIEIAKLLRAEPGTFGAPIDQREIWDELAGSPVLKVAIKEAEILLSEPIPKFTEKDYREIMASGSRERHYYFHDRRVKALATIVLAECLENKGRFLPRIEELISEFCAEKTWVVALRKKESLDNLEGRQNTIDLDKAMRAWELAITDDLLRDRLRQQTRTMIRENLERRIFAPYREMITGKRQPDRWLFRTNNWNPVCLAGVTGAALTIIESKEDRALFAAAAEKLSHNYLKGFQSDGYCSEGIGYWNFGVSHYLALSEALWQTTNGMLDLMGRQGLKDICLFGPRIEIFEGVFPAFADCKAYVPPRAVLVDYINRKFQAGLEAWELEKMETTVGCLYELVFFMFPNSAKLVPPATDPVDALETHTYFRNAGVVICRPNAKGRLGLALKGGHNKEHHNHNDIGTYTVSYGKSSPLMDIGSEVYTHRTFSDKRYESPILNSYGHPVPVVAGKLQLTGREVQAHIIKAVFTPLADTIVLDLSAAYDEPDLKRLERTFIYCREAAGSITIIDDVAFTTPKHFGTALMTLGTAKQTSTSSLLVWDKIEKEVINVQVQSSEALVLRSEVLQGDVLTGDKATRIGINLVQPVRETAITVHITPGNSDEVLVDDK